VKGGERMYGVTQRNSRGSIELAKHKNHG